MAPSNVLSMAQLRTLPLADQIKILMKNGGWSGWPPSPTASWGNGVWDRLRTKARGQRPLLPRACPALQLRPLGGRLCSGGQASPDRFQFLAAPTTPLLGELRQLTDLPGP